jgi:hypothetical protein
VDALGASGRPAPSAIGPGEEERTTGRSRKRPPANGTRSLPRVDGTFIDRVDQVADDPVVPEQMLSAAEDIGGVRGLALAVFCQAAFDRYRYRRRKKRRPLAWWMLEDGWTMADGLEAERWFEQPGDESEPFTLAWVRAQLPARGARSKPRRPNYEVGLFYGLFGSGPGVCSASPAEAREG